MMDSQQSEQAQAAPIAELSHTRNSIPNGIFGREGLRAGWRLLVYLLIVIALSAAIALGARLLIKPTGLPSPTGLLVQELIGFAVVTGAALFMSKLERRPLGDYGLPLAGLLGGRFWLGFLFGIVEICALIGLIRGFGGYSFGALALQGSQVAKWAAFHLVFFLFVGLFEEFLFRGYAQFTLGDGIGFWPAAAVLSLGFGAVHLGNPGEGLVGAASVALVGLFFCFTLRRTGNLWYAVGLHASFDWGESFLFSVPNSGTVMPGHLSDSLLHGPKWLTGGTVGPEGSIFCFVTMGLQFLVVALLFPAKKEATSGSVEITGGSAN
jgi:membrane protease YdiL (CAAX protease family)